MGELSKRILKLGFVKSLIGMRKLAPLLLVALSFTTQASDLKISNSILYIEDGAAFIVLNVKWNNAWNNETNHDGIWLFAKSLKPDGGFKHIKVMSSGHSVVSFFSTKTEIDFKVPDDRAGLFLYPSSEFRGNIELTLKLSIDPSDFEGINTRNALTKVFGIEMVEIPEGSFYLGDPDNSTRKYGSLYDPNGEENLIPVKSDEQKFKVAKSGDLYYEAPEGYEGDQAGTIPASYPNGFGTFHLMKYELMEGQYAEFVNSLEPAQRTVHLIHTSRGYNGSLSEEDGKLKAEFPQRPASFVSWNDAMAYADWAGLRPMTEFEFTKASRGPELPTKSDYPWGTKDKAVVQRLPDDHGQLVMKNGWTEEKLTTETGGYFGASYYWVMDLSGSLWERCVTIGHEKGRSFTGSHGDGQLSSEGFATNQDWPVGDEDSGGIGFRGGGFYGYAREYHEYNPFSPISYRPYGGWHGPMRSIAYGTRFVRTID